MGESIAGGNPAPKNRGYPFEKGGRAGKMKAAVYTGTRNVYYDMLPAAKSLLSNSDVEKIYFLIEDDEFPVHLPKEITVANVSKQRWFKKTGPNYNNHWTYMVLLRAAYPQIFTQLDTILSLDNDTIVCDNINELFNIDLGDNYFAGVPEPIKSTPEGKYLNMGVSLYNLAKMREEGFDIKCIKELNKKFYDFGEQDVMNYFGAGRKLILPPEYNISLWTQNRGKTKIRHFAAEPDWRHKPLVKKYAQMSWDEVRPKKRHG